jgi:hypothetical protein
MLVRTSLAASVLAIPAGAMAQVSGPDVIVGEIPDTSFYTSSGAIGGLHAYSIGTTSCNLGNQPLEWISSTNRHPVISQNMYRLLNGRFEQIGQSFLKHGFTALQGTVCGACSAYPNGSHLGPGCSDPYSASLNGSQSGLGPKFEVNAATGYFPYPFTNLPGSGTLNRRLQVRQTDLAIPGALYFVASRYVAPDDTEAGNDDNNQSYRRVTINASYSLSLQGTTQRTKPAIEAWRDHGLGVGVPDPGVMLTVIDIASDGRIVIGSKAIDLGGGNYRYEYALQNLNSDRSGGSFTIPLPTGAVVTNVGFHDVDYHSGEPYDLTDWTVTVGAGDVTWATTPYSSNPNANALRWDTVYSFWFETSSAPASASATLGMFKPGTPSSVSGAAWVPGGGPPPPPVPPANDNCASASTVSAGTTSFSSVNATTDGPAETLCDINGSNLVAADVWFRYTAPCAGTASVTTCGSGFDTRVAVYGAGCPGGADTAIACNDDSAACGSGSLQSSLSFAVASGAEYLIRVGGTGGATGGGSLNITGPNCAPPGPANNACASAIALQDGVGVAGTTVGATNDGAASCGASSTSADVWYSYTPAVTASVTVSTCNAASFDTVLSVHSACGGTQVACLDDTSGCAGYTTSLVTTMTGGVTYLIRVAGYNGATGTFTITASGGGSPPPPPPGPSNDSCDNRIGIPLGTITFSTVGATTDGPAHPTCASSGQDLITNDIWYNHPSTAAGTLTVSTCGSSYDSWIAVYDDYGCANFDTRLMACSDDFACPGGGTLQSQVAVSVQAGRSYTIRVGGFNGATGSGQLTLSLQTASSENLLVSFDVATSVPGVGTVADEDIVEYNPTSNTWSLLFDGSDVGLGGFIIDGMARTAAGDILLSFSAAGTVGGMTGGPGGSTTLDDSDIVRFVPASLGANTAGSFVFHFDGSDVGLTYNNEDVDAIAIAPDGRLILSTAGSTTANGVSSNDEDLIIFTATSLGSATAGSFAMHFDGSDVGLADGGGEDVSGAALTPDGDLLLSTLGSYAVPGLAGGDDDVLGFTPTSLGSATAGSYALYRALTSLGISSSSSIGAIDLRTSAFAKGDGGDPPLPACRADMTRDGTLDSQDMFVFLTVYFAADKAADFNKSGIVDSQDFFDFLSEFFAGCD